LEEGACLVVKNIGKPCAGKPHARIDEGGQVPACSLLYPISISGIPTEAIERTQKKLESCCGDNMAGSPVVLLK
jgi:hypothetical protein